MLHNDDFIAQLLYITAVYSVRLTLDDFVNNAEFLELCHDFVINFYLYVCK